MTVECAVQHTRAHDRMIFLLVDSNPSECPPPRPSGRDSQSLSVNSCISSSSLQPCSSLHSPSPLSILSLSHSLLPFCLSRSLSISFPAPLSCSPWFSAREYIERMARRSPYMHSRPMQPPCAVKLTLPFIKPLVHSGPFHAPVEKKYREQ